MSIYLEKDDVLDHLFKSCSIDQIQDFTPEKRGVRIHGHSTTVRLEQAFWSVIEDMANELDITVPDLINRVHDQCLVANEKNLASCLRVICIKYINVYYR